MGWWRSYHDDGSGNRHHDQGRPLRKDSRRFSKSSSFGSSEMNLNTDTDTDTDSQRRRFARVGRTPSEAGGMGISAEDKCRFSLSKYQEVAFLFSSFPLCISQLSTIT